MCQNWFLNAIYWSTAIMVYKTDSSSDLNPVKHSGIRWLHFEVSSAIQV